MEQLSKPFTHNSCLICVKRAASVEIQVTAACIAIAPAAQDSKHCSSSILTLSRRHLFSLMAPMQPTKPMIMTNVPVTISRLAADRDGKEEERVAKFPWVTASQMPTPRIPQPPNWENKEKQRNSVIVPTQPQIWNHVNMAVEHTGGVTHGKKWSLLMTLSVGRTKRKKKIRGKSWVRWNTQKVTDFLNQRHNLRYCLFLSSGKADTE